MLRRFFAALGLFALVATPLLARAESPFSWLTPEQKRRADQLISLFENATTTIQYGYVENLHDGRGFTVGRGFTTATGDASDVVKAYTARVPKNPLAKYLPRLKQLAKKESGSVSGLGGFAAAWKKAAKDPVFRTAQDEIVDRDSYVPAMKLADAIGAKLPLTRAEIYDAFVMHGGGDDPDGAPALVWRAWNEAGGGPMSGLDEKTWLATFLEVRRRDLLNPADEASRDAWSEATGRIDVFVSLLDKKNLDLHGPITVIGDLEGVVP